jgi:glycosyltransferase involved in cell wall biosynthesis
MLGEDFAPAPGWHSHVLDGIRLEVLHVPYSNRMSFRRRIVAFLRFALGASLHVRKFKADVVFATSTPLTVFLPGLAAKLWHRIPLVFEVRDLWPELPIAVGALRNPISRMSARLLEWSAYRAASKIVALSPGMAEGVTRRGIAPTKIQVIPNSCDIDLFEVSKEAGAWVRPTLGISPADSLVVYVGTFGVINKVSYLVDLASAMATIAPSVHFLLVGDGAEREAIAMRARTKGVLGKNLTMWSPVPKQKVPDILGAATVAVSVFAPIPAMAANSANKFFDGLAAGKPVVINYLGWQAQLLTESGAGVVLPEGDPASAAKLLAAFLADDRKIVEASAQARHLAHDVFSRDKLYLQLETVLLSEASKAQRPAI